MAGPKASTAAEARNQDRRKTILRAAIEVFARKGYHGCRIADVAERRAWPTGSSTTTSRTRMSCSRPSSRRAGAASSRACARWPRARAPLEQKVRGIADVAFEAYRVDPRAVKVLILEIARSPAGPGEPADGLHGGHPPVLGDVLAGRRPRASCARAWIRCWPRRCSSAPSRWASPRSCMGLVDPRDPELLAQAQGADRRLLPARRPAGAPPPEVSWKKERRSPLRGPRRPSAPDHRSAAGAQRAVAGGGAGAAGRRWAGRRRTPRCGCWCSPARGRRCSARAAISAQIGGGRLPGHARGPARVRRAAHALQGCRKPTVARVNGHALGRRAGAGAGVRPGGGRGARRAGHARRSTWGSSP